MGDKNVANEANEMQMRAFTKAVLNDLQALEKMLAGGRLEQNTLRIGAEQEMFLVDSAMHPAPLVMEILENADDERLTTEIGRFNIEANLTPLEFSGDCLSRLESELNEVFAIVKKAARNFKADAVLCGILPTIQQSDLVEANLTPTPRYTEMNRILTHLHGDERLIHIKGLDELRLHLKDTFIEFCNTSFQIHLQVGISDFVSLYNWAQAVTAPVLASAVNSPLLLGHRLWHETRLALFQHAVDERSPTHHARNRQARVTFGRDWARNSILDVFHEDVARYRIIFSRELEENSLESLESGKIPQLQAWRMHNGTIWRWNRPCYGVLNGVPSLRIEARFLPAGPTVLDEMANAAFFLGLMTALPEEFGDVTEKMSFDDAKNNFFSAARFGLKSQIVWLDGESHPARRLILEELLPRVRRGLQKVGIKSDDIERYLGVLEERVAAEKTGARWMLDSLAAMDKSAKKNVRMRSLTAAMKVNQESGEPLHKWDLANIPDCSDWIDNYKTIEQFMTTDLFTVRPEDVLDLAANLMHWKHVRHVPVEDDEGKLVGIISHRDLLELYTHDKTNGASEIVVRDVMKQNLVTISPETPTLDALSLMREKNIGCLPVIKADKLIGLITAHDFLTVSAKLFEERLQNLNQ
ncbi:MAG TPA: CBS domain-containing protein [Pyrinomonadaceae bacterium]|jgi:CBS domain-containing protein/gamma-glutamyl:cysteine ligase YbdK (ATP-grasp superfamily)